MKKLFDRKNNKKGFTLAELLIVVAIIAVLVAISIPVFTSKLEKAREATDVANMRAAKAVAVAKYLDSNSDALTGGITGSTNSWYYDASSGELKNSAPNGYGKGTSTDGGTTYGTTDVDGYKGTDVCTNGYIKVTFVQDSSKDNVTIKESWEGINSK
jgi:type IV pilus assembly protein PilA